MEQIVISPPSPAIAELKKLVSMAQTQQYLLMAITVIIVLVFLIYIIKRIYDATRPKTAVVAVNNP